MPKISSECLWINLKVTLMVSTLSWNQINTWVTFFDLSYLIGLDKTMGSVIPYG